ncbi:poly-beta-hydroxybutyrate polymerase [mine drainage metagenome]|uniref:Poly(3-hydroxyalkanoate) polymerase subunit PhaC n=1 Tax=mine drainage metagenome TaxID=410659 RepID=T1AVZ1_9ZZZZ|nr:class III poly(R)-hydroxyalkanoic acid synthase subunit PhaC [Metallibacterium sp.]
MLSPLRIDPVKALQEVDGFKRKLAAGMQNLRNVGDFDFGASAREAVYHEDKITLWHFKPTGKPSGRMPILISYALVNTPWMVDLQADRSLVARLLELGEDVYLIEWGYPDLADRWLTLEDYILGYLDRCIDQVRQRHGLERINLLGICEGGAFSLCYAALRGHKLQNLITMVTPVDFHTPDNMLSNWTRQMDVDLFVDTLGNVPADLMNWCYLTLKPVRLNQQKYVGMVDVLDDPKEITNFLRMEKWIFDSPDQAGEAFRQFIKDFYQANKLIKGEVEIGGERVDLGSIKLPILNIFAEQDHLVPPSAARPLRGAVGTTDYTELSFKGGHIGIYVSGRAQREVPGVIHGWLGERQG